MRAGMCEGTAALLTGQITHLHRREGLSDFLFDEKQKNNLAIAVLSTFATEGNEGLAASMSFMAENTVESADLLTFELDGTPIEACVWSSNFANGDYVHVVAECINSSWKGFGIYRPEDGLIAVYPHCTRGRFAHFRAAGFWALVISTAIFLIMMLLMCIPLRTRAELVNFALMAWPTLFILTVLFVLRGAWKLMKVVRLAERIFTAFGWPNPKWIDLRSGVKRKKREGDPPSFGVSLFRYDSNR